MPGIPAETFTATIANAPESPLVYRASPPSWTSATICEQTPPPAYSISCPVVNLGPTMLVAIRISGGFEATSRSEQTVLAHVANAPTSDLDTATDLLPWMTDLVASEWTESPGLPYDAIEITYRENDESTGRTTSVFGPRGTSIEIPSNASSLTVTLLDRSDMDYVELRQRDHRLVTLLHLAKRFVTLPSGVTVRESRSSVVIR